MRTAISVGALTLTLGGMLLAVAPTPVSAVARAGDCEGGGLLGGVTDGLCEAVGAVNNAVSGTLNDTVGGGVSDLVGDALGSAVSGAAKGLAVAPPPDVLPSGDDGYGQTMETPSYATKDGKNPKDDNSKKDDKSGKAQSSEASALAPESILDQPRQALLPEAVPELFMTPWDEAAEDASDVGDPPDPKDPKDAGDVGDADAAPPQSPGNACSPLADSPGCAGTSANAAPKESATPQASPSPTPSHDGGAVPAEESARWLTDEPVRPAQSRRRAVETDERGDGGGDRAEGRQESSGSENQPPVVDAEAPRLDLLWPAGPVMRKLQRTVTPTRSPDPLGTAFTMTLLVAAILAVRLLYVRRISEKSIPLEPLRMKRHRTA
ncbi:hypothetical protein ACFY19_37160 [Streptosporangium saharense]|uniref:hypothetical protein n=1 Tax=Streptosporangium saharense TaxID=1706840 RepID=UPI0036A275FA